MDVLEKAKDYFWSLPGLTDRQKEQIFSYIKGKIRGEVKGQRDTGIYGQYAKYSEPLY